MSNPTIPEWAETGNTVYYCSGGNFGENQKFHPFVVQGHTKTQTTINLPDYGIRSEPSQIRKARFYCKTRSGLNNNNYMFEVGEADSYVQPYIMSEEEGIRRNTLADEKTRRDHITKTAMEAIQEILNAGRRWPISHKLADKAIEALKASNFEFSEEQIDAEEEMEEWRRQNF